jgi:hypothetical protein
MAYPTVNGPYGLKPVNLVGGQVFAGATRSLPIGYGYATAIGYGDLVNITRGAITKHTGTTDSTAVGLVGVFLGCSYTSPTTKQKLFAQNWVASTLAGDALAYVCDDPDTVFKAVVCSATTVLASGSQAVVGQNYGLIQNAVNGNTGNSQVALLWSATTTTNTAAARVVGLVSETAIVTPSVGSSSSTTITLTTALPNALVVGTDVGSIASNGQYIASGSYVSVAAAAGATSVTVNAAPLAAIASGATVIFTQYPEVLVKLNFGVHAYYTALAIT